MPHQAMTNGLETIALTEGGQSLGLRPVPGILLRMNRAGFHGIFGCDDVELGLDQVQLRRVEFVRCAEIQRRADEQDVLKRILQ